METTGSLASTGLASAEKLSFLSFRRMEASGSEPSPVPAARRAAMRGRRSSVKLYPSIPRSTGQTFREFDAYVFDKVDGSNLRVEWTRKRGWFKFGTRQRLFDETDEVFGGAIALFRETLAQGIEKVARDERWDMVTVFMEFWGEKSFAGEHETCDPKRLTLFDVNPYKKGILGPKEFLDLFGHLPIPRFLGRMRWTRGFVERVRLGQVEGVTFEGVVGKAGKGHDLVMSKAKTQAWIDKVMEKFGIENGRKIVDS